MWITSAASVLARSSRAITSLSSASSRFMMALPARSIPARGRRGRSSFKCWRRDRRALRGGPVAVASAAVSRAAGQLLQVSREPDFEPRPQPDHELAGVDLLFEDQLSGHGRQYRRGCKDRCHRQSQGRDEAAARRKLHHLLSRDLADPRAGDHSQIHHADSAQGRRRPRGEQRHH